MASPVFSVRLWDLPSYSEPPGIISGPMVPAGFVWVVRDVRMINTFGNNGLLISPILLSAGGTLTICASPTFNSLGGQLYHWHGRAVVVAGETLIARTDDLGWTMVVDGYQLTA